MAKGKYIPVAERKRKKKREEIRTSMVEQLRAAGKDTPYLLSKVEQYMDSWDNAEALAADIKERGQIVEEPNSKGIMVKKPNPSIAARQKEIVTMNAIEAVLKLHEPVKEKSSEDGYL